MLTIRLQRTGKKHQPFFRIVSADSRRHVSAQVIEVLGNFDPRSKKLVFNETAIRARLEQGATLSNRLARLLKPKLKHDKIIVKNRPPRKPKEKSTADAKPIQPVKEAKPEESAEALAPEVLDKKEKPGS